MFSIYLALTYYFPISTVASVDSATNVMMKVGISSEAHI